MVSVIRYLYNWRVELGIGFFVFLSFLCGGTVAMLFLGYVEAIRQVAVTCWESKGG